MKNAEKIDSLLSKNLTIRDRSKDLPLMKLHNKYLSGEEVVFHPYEAEENLNVYKRLLSFFGFKFLDTEKEVKGIVITPVVRKGKVGLNVFNKKIGQFFVPEKNIIRKIVYEV